MPKNTRTILIVWSWRRSGHGEGIWQVAGSSHVNDQAVCWDQLASEDSMKELKLMVRSYLQENGELMVFLHRQHGYNQDHIKEILQLTPMTNQTALKCFLFGEGAESIYLTSDPRGLLGTEGTFSARINYKNQQLEVSSIADYDRMELDPSHFDYVWEVYKFSFRRRLFELKEDLLTFLLAENETGIFEPGHIYSILSTGNDKLMILRLLSLVGRIRKNSNLAKEIRTFERKNTRTYTFDDCGVFLESSYGSQAAEQYDTLAVYVLNNLLAKGVEVDLQTLRTYFDSLLAEVSGPTYN